MLSLIRSTSKNDHITQAVVEGDATTGYRFNIYQVYAPGGRHLRRCSLETGKVTPTFATARSHAIEAFERQTGVRLTTPLTGAQRLLAYPLAALRTLARWATSVKFGR